MTEAAETHPGEERFRTGVAGLDEILHGGLLRGGVYILRGMPGSGKTTLAAQLCFNHIAGGGRALFVTLLSESHARLIQQFRGFGFFAAGAMAQQFQMISAFTVLDTEHLSGVVKLLGREMRRHQATILAVDGPGTMDGVSHPERDVRLFIHELQGYAQASGCVCLLLTASARPMDSPEYAMADGVIALTATTAAMRTERSLQVHKMRGSDFVSGIHFYRITPDGIVVFPRVETLAIRGDAAPPPGSPARQSTGCAGLDAMTGGLPTGSSTLLVGAAGTGKTTLGLQFLGAATAHEPGLAFGFHEAPAANLARAKTLGCNMDRLVALGHLEFVREPPYGGLIDALCRTILENIARRGVRRLFIDGLDGFARTAFMPERAGSAITALIQALRDQGVTSVFSCDLAALPDSDLRAPGGSLSAFVDNAILLRHTEIDLTMQRQIVILKMRSSSFDASVRGFGIGPDGITVADPPGGGDAAMRQHAGSRFMPRSSGEPAG